MSDPKDPFELEPEKENGDPKVPPSLGAAEPAVPEIEVPDPDEPQVDTRTVAERKGEQQPRGAVESIGTPEGWPGEALRFPLKTPGPSVVVLGLITLLLLDLLGLHDALRFPGWMLKLVVLVFLLRAQFHVIGTSAAGRDAPEGWREALAFDGEDLKLYLKTLVFFACALVPGILLWIFDQVAIGVLLLVLASMYAAVVALGAALRDPSLKWPWGALKWISLRPLHCVAGSLGWWVLFGAEVALLHLVTEGPVLYGFVAIVLRVTCLYVLLVSARAIGVMGRAWTTA